MSGASPPPDNSAQVEAMREQAQREAQAAADQKAQQHLTDLGNLRTTARAGATGSVNDYFNQHGVDPSAYSGSIETQLNNMLSGISPSDENPGASFTGAGQSIWDALTTAGQTKAMNTVNQNFAPNFESSKVPFTLDDPYIAGIAGDQYNDADKIIQNMLARGVLTSSGAASAEADLANQKPGVTAKLTDIGSGLISKEQSDLSGIGNKARQTAGNIQLGQTFDPSTYTTRQTNPLMTSLAHWAIRFAHKSPENSLTLLDLPQSVVLAKVPEIRHSIRQSLRELPMTPQIIQLPNPVTPTLFSSVSHTEKENFAWNS